MSRTQSVIITVAVVVIALAAVAGVMIYKQNADRDAWLKCAGSSYNASNRISVALAETRCGDKP